MLTPARSVVFSSVSQRAYRKTHAPGPSALRGGDKQSDVELVKAARAYSDALDEEPDVDQDEVVASIMGAKSTDSMSPAAQQYKDKIKEQIAKKAAELEAQEEAGREEFNFGVALYERGRYQESESMLKTALDVAGMNTKLGGDIQIQLALAMAANKKEEECCSLFKHLEETHPVRAIQKQAANLRFIMEAPKLEIGEDEKVKVPLMDLDSNKPRAGKRAPSRVGGGGGGKVVKKEKSFEEDFWENYRPPSYATNKYVWAAALAVGLAAAYYSVYYKDCIPM